MTRHILWNRREFLQRLGYLSGLGVAGLHSVWGFSDESHSIKLRSAEGRTGPLLAYVASWEHGIQVFTVHEKGWQLSQSIPSDKPSFLALHPTRQFIYAVNEIDSYEGLPTATVEAYSIDSKDGWLALLNRQPLSLSATAPRHLAVSPDGSRLVVAVHGGGSYNVFPVQADGSLEHVSVIYKEVGSGPSVERQNASHPQMLIFDATYRRLISADLGSDTLNVFTLAEDRLNVVHRRAVPLGSGPRFLTLHPSGRMLYVLNELHPSISCFGYDAASGRILDLLHNQPLHDAGSLKENLATTMAMHSSGKFLVTSCSRATAVNSVNSEIACWSIDSSTGKLQLLQRSDGWMNSSPVESIFLDRNALFILSRAEGIFRIDIDPGNGLLKNAIRVANVPAPKTMLLHDL